MSRLRAADLSGPKVPASQYLRLRAEELVGNPRAKAAYKEMCCEKVGLGPEPGRQRYPHLQKSDDFDLLRWVVRRGSGCFSGPGTPFNTVREFKHRLITRGAPVRVSLHRLSKLDTEWVGKAVAEDVERGQLRQGSSLWGFPASPTKASPEQKPVWSSTTAL